MRILQITTALVPGGVQSLLQNYGSFLQKEHIVFDYVLQEHGEIEIEERLQNEGSRLFFVDSFNKKPIKSTIQLYRIIKLYPEYEIVHCHQNFVNIIPLLASKLAGVKTRISHSHSYRPEGSVLTKTMRRIARPILKFLATDYWACSVEAYKWLYGDTFDLNTSSSFILKNAINTSEYQYNAQNREIIRKKYGWEKQCVFTCVASLSANKNQSFLLDVFSRVAQDLPSSIFCIVGDGNIKDELLQKSKKLNLENRVCFLGKRTDIKDLLDASDCFLLASRSEGLCISIIEALSNGLTCIVSNVLPKAVYICERVIPVGIDDKKDIETWRKTIMSCVNSKQLQHDDRLRSIVGIHGFDLIENGIILAQKYRELKKL